MQSTKRIVTLAAVAMVVAIASAAHGAVLAEWDITQWSGDHWNPNVTVTGEDTNVDASGISLVGLSNANSAGGNKASAIGGRSWNSATFSKSDEYLSFTITPTGGAVLDIDTIHLSEAMNNNNLINDGGPNEGPAEFRLRSSLDNFDTNILTGVITGGFQDINGASTYHALSLGSDFDAIDSTVEFRLYGTGFASFRGQWFIGNPADGPFDNFTVEGSVIPEPATMALVGLGLLTIARRRRA